MPKELAIVYGISLPVFRALRKICPLSRDFFCRAAFGAGIGAFFAKMTILEQ
jgi:hypothetical protein